MIPMVTLAMARTATDYPEHRSRRLHLEAFNFPLPHILTLSLLLSSLSSWSWSSSGREPIYSTRDRLPSYVMLCVLKNLVQGAQTNRDLAGQKFLHKITIEVKAAAKRGGVSCGTQQPFRK